MISRFTSILIIVFSFQSFASFENYEFGSRSISLGNAFVGLANDCWGVLYNPAGIDCEKRNEFSCYYSPAQFGLSKLRTIAGSCKYTTKLGTFASTVRKFGFEKYKEFAVSFAYAKKVAGVYTGVNLNYYNLSIMGYGTDACITFDAGAILPLFKNFYLGVSVKNMNAGKIGTKKEKLPQVFLTGICYSPIEYLYLLADYHKEVGYSGSIKSGVEYKVLDIIFLRIGVSDNPDHFTSGLGLEYKIIRFDYAFLIHSELGYSQFFTISFKWNN